MNMLFFCSESLFAPCGQIVALLDFEALYISAPRARSCDVRFFVCVEIIPSLTVIFIKVVCSVYLFQYAYRYMSVMYVGLNVFI